ncbi:MAG: hypothetical protein V3V92_03690 [Candidatus Hydrothermarchaeales archaeon]
MEVTPIFSRVINDYKKNPKFIVPHAIELILNFALISAAALVITMAALALIPSLTIWDLNALLHGNVPFILISLIVFGALILVIIITLLGAAARAAIITMAQESHANGTTDLRSGLKGAKRYAGGVFLYKILTGLVLLALLVIGAIPFALGSVFFGVFALILAFILYLAFYLFVFFTPQFIVAREGGVISGIKDSMEFVENNFSSVLIYVAVVIAISLGMALFINILGLPGIFIENQFLNIAFIIFHSLFSLGINLVIAPYFDIVKTYMVMEV